VIAVNAILLLKPAIADLMDHSPDVSVLESIRSIATSVPGVLAIEKLAVRRVGLFYRAIVHVQADPALTLRNAHTLGGAVTRAIHGQLSQVQSVVVHMEPYERPPA
jgi:divalent metal cation (Fe/Co/Zn/Cd) transporter